MKAKKNEFKFSAEAVARALGGSVVSANEVRAPGPGHTAKDNSLLITIDPSAPSGFLVHSFAGDDALQCKDYVRERLGLASWQKGYSSRPGTDYVYRDKNGSPYMKVTRQYKQDGTKFFCQYRYKDDDWVMGTKGLPRIPYRLNEWLGESDQTIYFVEGEKDSDRLVAAGLLATTASEGASASWKPEMAQWFKGKNVVILPDNDEPGRAHAQKVAAGLRPVAASIKIVELPGLPEKGDVSDWLNGCGSVDELTALCDATMPLAANDNDTGFTVNVEPSRFGILTESDIALDLANRAVGRLRYCHSIGGWYFWNGCIWRRDTTQMTLDWARKLAYSASERAEENAQSKIRRASFARAVESLCRADQRLAITADAWDQEPFKLGTPNGTVNLRTGALEKAESSDGITKTAAYAPADNADCPTWRRFLSEATKGDEGLIRFLQQWCGYALTGDTSEHALIFVHGAGGNGKSVFLNTISTILGQYAVVASMDTFTASRDTKHPTDLAMLRGARLVTASETEEGRAWAEARIKQLTGGDPISARFMRQDFFTFKPQFKLTVVGNHRPTLVKVDDAMRRRFNVIAFENKPATPDPMLESKLLKEAPEILRWMIEGCLDWQKNGLVRPESVKQATEQYFDDQDLFSAWLEEWCEVDIGNQFKWEPVMDLFASWKGYAESNGEQAGTAKSLSSALRARGLERKRITGGRTAYVGIRLSSAGGHRRSEG
ncbi:phage/plasmid primase, P4 family [Tardiphaga sp. 538_B7_N1_4]|uniref:phage/plasmid primase, P4 family n=1 Tax=Tardiphaga sp. 538_B7_N1_4 TaxID=3240778 RepID=UPI003F260EF9